MSERNIVIIGGGFAGIQVAKRLERRLPPEWTLHLMSQENFITYNPLLPEVVGASVLRSAIAYSASGVKPVTIIVSAEPARLGVGSPDASVPLENARLEPGAKRTSYEEAEPLPPSSPGASQSSCTEPN